MKKIITIAGTSIFTNRLENNEVRNEYKELEKEPYAYWDEHLDAGNLEKLTVATRDALKNNKDDSAEIKSILAIANELKEDVEIYLLATDTVLSALACLLIKDWFKDEPQFSFKIVKKDENKKNITEDLTEDNIEMLVIKNLRIFSDSSTSVDSDNKIDDDTINSGFLNLIDKIWDIIKKTDKQDCILNISGGYKASIPILTIMGQLYNIPLKYIYEGSDQLVSIDRFPINFDWGIIDLFVPYLDKYNLALASDIEIEELKALKLISEYSENSKKKYKISPMGTLLKKFFDEKMPTSKQVLGHFAEYKLYEYFHLEDWNSVFSSVKRDVTISVEGEKAQIDLELQNKNNEIFIIEVKSFGQVYNKKDFNKEILQKAKKRVSLYEKKGENIQKYILAFYKFEAQLIKHVFCNLNSLKKALGIKLQVCYFNLPSSKEDYKILNYQQFVQKALTKEELKEIDLDNSTSSNVENTFKP